MNKKNMKLIFTTILIVLLGPMYAQSDFMTTPSVLSNSGGSWATNNYNISFTLGEIAIETFDNYEDYILTQGFHQDNFQIIDIIENNYDFQVSVFPNPTSGFLNINCQIENKRGDLYIKDINGRIIYSLLNFSTSKNQLLDLSQFSKGAYFLEIFINSTQKIVYQIKKIN